MDIVRVIDQKYINNMISVSKLLKQQINLPKGWSEFNFFRCYRNNEFLILSTNLEYISHYFDYDFYNNNICHRFAEALDDGVILHSWFEKDFTHKYSQKKYNFKDGLTIVVQHQEYTNFYHFCSTKNEVMLSDVLVQEVYSFIESFHNIHKNIVDEGIKYKIYIQLHEVNDYHYERLRKTQRLMKFIQTKRFYLNDDVYLTNKEVEVLNLHIKGYSVIQLSLLLYISRDTANSHIYRLKSKFKASA